jgi:hypothetical protein
MGALEIDMVVLVQHVDEHEADEAEQQARGGVERHVPPPETLIIAPHLAKEERGKDEQHRDDLDFGRDLDGIRNSRARASGMIPATRKAWSQSSRTSSSTSWMPMTSCRTVRSPCARAGRDHEARGGAFQASCARPWSPLHFGRCHRSSGGSRRRAKEPANAENGGESHESHSTSAEKKRISAAPRREAKLVSRQVGAIRPSQAYDGSGPV